jgi:phthiocerol/phenolphthiocerol synthesis type-I polyketide synthase E
MAERRILDVGCGRGGAISVVDHFFSPKSLMGIDLSSEAIEFCRRTHKKPHIVFQEGDAENLSVADASFDVIMNSESSHTYPSLHKFYREVARVLAPGGHFLYTDLLPAAQWHESLGYLQLLGLVAECDRDISSNVLLSCDQIAETRKQAFAAGNDPSVMQEFLSSPGSRIYEGMRRGNLPYRMLRFHKTDERQSKSRNGGAN